MSSDDLPALIENVRRHLKSDGLFVGSIAIVPDAPEACSIIALENQD